MSRLPLLGRDQLDERQRELWDAVLGGPRGAGITGVPSALAGPFNAWLYVPSIGTPAACLGEELRFRTSLDEGHRELLICVVAAHWRAEYGFWAHARIAERAGVDPAALDAIRADGQPVLSADAEAAVAVAHCLLQSGRLDDAAYAAAEASLGRTRLLEVVMLVGYYTLVCFTLNAFDTQLPEGVDGTWPR